jgi:hypothetical protein
MAPAGLNPPNLCRPDFVSFVPFEPFVSSG